MKNGNGSNTASKAAAKKREGAQTPRQPDQQDEPDSPTAAQTMNGKFDSPGGLSIPHPKYMRANTQHLYQRRHKDVQRATIPNNRSPVCVRVLSNETPFGSDLHDPHSPMNMVNDSILPERFIRERQKKMMSSTCRSGFSGAKGSNAYSRQRSNGTSGAPSGGASTASQGNLGASKGHRKNKSVHQQKLGYPSFYTSQQYHIIHEKGALNGHEMRVEVNNYNTLLQPSNAAIRPYKGETLRTVGFN